MNQTITPAMRKSAQQVMINYVNGLAERVPAGTKAAEVARNAQTCTRLQKLAQVMTGGKDVYQAVAQVFADKNAAYQHTVITGLARGLMRHLASKQAGVKGVSRHPSVNVTGKTTSPSSGVSTVGPKMKTMPASC
jgi:hypothetical protein